MDVLPDEDTDPVSYPEPVDDDVSFPDTEAIVYPASPSYNADDAN